MIGLIARFNLDQENMGGLAQALREDQQALLDLLNRLADVETDYAHLARLAAQEGASEKIAMFLIGLAGAIEEAAE